MAHARLSPSGAERWANCPGSVALEDGLPEQSSKYADEGTQAHEWAALILQGEQPLILDAEAEQHIRVYTDFVQGLAQPPGCDLLVEVAVPIDHITKEEGATGTSDTIVVQDNGDGTCEIFVVDLKYGKGVLVDAEDNLQLLMYASGSTRVVELIYGLNVHRVTMAIVQPRVSEIPSVWSIPRYQMDAKIMALQSKANIAWTHHTNYKAQGKLDALLLVPGEKQCRFCKAKAGCPAVTREVMSTVMADFVDLDAPGAILNEIPLEPGSNDLLAKWYGKLDVIEDWCKSVRARVAQELELGRPVAGYKLVAGRKGNRKWASEQEAEAAMKSMRLKQDEMYDMKLISPAKAEKLLKDTPRRWTRISELITQDAGSPTVAPESDPRPPVTASTDDMPDMSLLE